MTKQMTINDAKAIREEVLDFLKALETAELTDPVEFCASNGTEFILDQQWNGQYTLEITDADRTTAICTAFDTFEDISIEEEFVGGEYRWVMTIDVISQDLNSYVRLPLVSADRVGSVIA